MPKENIILGWRVSSLEDRVFPVSLQILIEMNAYKSSW
jgi:hypothetical protein